MWNETILDISWQLETTRCQMVSSKVRKWNKLKSDATTADVAILIFSSGIIILQKHKFFSSRRIQIDSLLSF